ncbi:MAG TPA: phosphonate ABC transporter, permease protein PhnE, partial [Burkholderiales bacterium]|nr:phosphonate ABC transporter, permease protein PhnE [Burkholderiales bacterium]
MSATLDREWRRFTPPQRIGRFALYFGIVVACVASLRTVEIIPEFLYDAPEQVADLLKRMWPIEWSYYPDGVHDAMVETLHIASLG